MALPSTNGALLKMNNNHFPGWVMTVAAVPAAFMLWGLLAWTPKSRKQWLIAVGMAIYIAIYYIIFIR
jgi:hypothetical protein